MLAEGRSARWNEAAAKMAAADKRVDQVVIPLGLIEYERRQDGDWVALTLGPGD